MLRSLDIRSRFLPKRLSGRKIMKKRRMKKAWLVLVTILFALIIYYPAECEQDKSETANNVSEKYGEIYYFDISASTFTGDYSECRYR